MNDVDARILQRLAVDEIQLITTAPSFDSLEGVAEWEEDRWLARAFGDIELDGVYTYFSKEACLLMVRVIRSARRMRKLELNEMLLGVHGS